MRGIFCSTLAVVIIDVRFLLLYLPQEHNIAKVEEHVKELFDKTTVNEKGLAKSLETLEQKVNAGEARGRYMLSHSKLVQSASKYKGKIVTVTPSEGSSTTNWFDCTLSCVLFMNKKRTTLFLLFRLFFFCISILARYTTRCSGWERVVVSAIGALCGVAEPLLSELVFVLYGSLFFVAVACFAFGIVSLIVALDLCVCVFYFLE